MRRHFRRLVTESSDEVTWHFIFNPDAGARPKAPFAYDDPADVMAGRYRAMERNGGVQGGYLDTALIPAQDRTPDNSDIFGRTVMARIFALLFLVATVTGATAGERFPILQPDQMNAFAAKRTMMHLQVCH